jgi:hypothetical protein
MKERAAAASLHPPLEGEGRRAISVFTRVFDALWRAGVECAAKKITPSRQPSLALRLATSPLQGEVKKESAEAGK